MESARPGQGGTLSDIAIRRPVFTAMLSLAIIVLGILSFGRLATDLYPPVNFPFLLVNVVYPGASPEDIEKDVTKPIEDGIAGIAGIKKLQSFTRESGTLIMVQFDLEVDLDEARNAVRDRVGAVEGQLPAGVEKPVIQPIDLGALPVVVVAFATNGPLNEARWLADDRLRPLLEQVPGVGAVNVVGGQDREIQIDLDLDKVRALGLDTNQIGQRIGIENISVPVGQFESRDYAIGVRASAQYRSVADLSSTVVQQTPDGRVVRLGEIADVNDGWTDATRYVRNNGKDAVTLEIVKKSGANTVDVARGVLKVLDTAMPNLGHGATYKIISDQSIDIEANTHEVWSAIRVGGVMAVLVILFFLLDLRGTLISSIALPTSIIGTFSLMYALGFSVNMMTLLAMSLAIGLLIDDAVVVRESITRRLELGDDPVTAASRGTREIALAVLATTMSLVAVFVPIAFMTGVVGQFFRQFGLTLACAVLLSLWVAFTLDPMLSARLSKRHLGQRTGIPARIEAFLSGVDRFYQRILAWVLEHRWKTIGIASLALVMTGVLATRLPAEFMAKEDRGEVAADVRLPIGTDLDVTDALARRIEPDLLAIPGVKQVYTIVGHENQANRVRFRVRMAPKAERVESLPWYEDHVREALTKDAPHAEVNIVQPSTIEGLGDWPPLMLIVQGNDLDALRAESVRVRDLLANVPGTSDVRLTVDGGQPELELGIDRDLAADRGVPAGLVAMTARSLVEGTVLGTLRDGGPEAEIRLRGAPSFTDSKEDLESLPIATPRGVVPISDLAKIEMGSGASEIQHFNRMRSMSIWSQVKNGASLGAVMTGFDAAIAAAPLADGHFITIDGQARDMAETGAAMGLAVVVALIFIFMVLASQFESLVHPFTLLVSVPLAMVGAILALVVTGKSISMGSQIGIILLMGLVTKNAILLVDGALVGIREGLTPVDAMRRAGPRRLRPILMTSVAMAFGMLPSALGKGVGSEFRSPMAIAVIGGVLSSTALTLLVVPVIFVWMERLRGWAKDIAGRVQGESKVHVHAILDEEPIQAGLDAAAMGLVPPGDAAK